MTNSFLFKELNAKTKHILAKKNPDITLAQHIFDSLLVIKNYLDKNQNLWEAYFKNNIKTISFDQAKEALLFSIYFHDIGKATQEFQVTLMQRQISYHP